MLHKEKFNLFLEKFRDSCTESSKKIRYWYVSRSNSLSDESVVRLENILIIISVNEYLEKKYNKKWEFNLLKDLISEKIVTPYKDKGSFKKGSALQKNF